MNVERITAGLAERYRIERKLGEGGMAIVYLALDLKHDRQVALKVLRPELAAALGTERFLREIRIAARLNHPHILPLFDSGHAAGAVYYVTPYITGESLRDKLIKEHRLDVEAALALARDVGGALEHAHSRGVVHRDIKPANILLQDGAAVVADFGIALAVSEASGERLTGTGLSLGTPDYMSPEQATGDHDVDHRADIFALGAVLFEVLAGAPPHRAPTVQATIAKVIAERPEKLRQIRSDVPDAVEVAVDRALAKEPSERFDRAADMVTALQGVQTKRARPVVWLVAALAVLAVGLVAAAFVRFSDRPAVTAVEHNSIAILPADASGDAAPFAVGLDYLLYAGVDGISGWRAVHPRTVRARWSEFVSTEPVDLETVLQIARAANASYAVVPTVVDIPTGLRLSADVFALRENERIEVAIAEGPTDSLVAVAEDLAIQVMRSVLQGEGAINIDLEQIAGSSPEAVRAFLAGEVFLRELKLREARSAYHQALEVDSTFALAHYRLMEVYSWTEGGDPELLVRHRNLANRFSRRLSRRERVVVQALAVPDVSGRVAALKHAAGSYPDDASVLYWLGETMLHDEEALASLGDVDDVFQRAIRLDPNHPVPYIHAIHTALHRGDAIRARQLVDKLHELGSTAEDNLDTRAGLLAYDVAFGDSALQAAALIHLSNEQENLALLPAAAEFLIVPRYVNQLEQVISIFIDQASNLGRDPKAGGLFLGFVNVLWKGHGSRGAQLVSPIFTGAWSRTQLLSRFYAAGAPLPDTLLALQFGADTITTIATMENARRAVSDSVYREHAVPRMLQASVVAVDAAREIDHVRALEWLNLVADSSDRVGQAELVTSLRWAIRVREAYADWRSGNLSDAERVFREAFDRPKEERIYPETESERRLIHWWLARLAIDMERWERAENLLNTYAWGQVLMPFDRHPMAQFYLGRVYEQLSKPRDAVEAYGYFLEHWAEADTEVQPLVDQARARLAALMRASG